MLTTLGINLVLALVVMLLVWLLSLKLEDASIIDPFWGMGFVLVAWNSVLINGNYSIRMLILAACVSLWGIRLSLFLLIRNWGHPEDRRYRAMRNKRGTGFWWQSLFVVFWLQAFLLWLISFPLQFCAVGDRGTGLNWIDFVGISTWAVGLFFESVSDWQLYRFKSDSENEGKVLRTGLWRYSRHPNYFGDFCVWWGFYLMSIGGGGFWTFASPIVMSLFLMRVSGVSLLEKTIVDRRPEYRSYIRSTNAFFPGPPGSGSSK